MKIIFKHSISWQPQTTVASAFSSRYQFPHPFITGSHVNLIGRTSSTIYSADITSHSPRHFHRQHISHTSISKQRILHFLRISSHTKHRSPRHSQATDSQRRRQVTKIRKSLDQRPENSFFVRIWHKGESTPSRVGQHQGTFRVAGIFALFYSVATIAKKQTIETVITPILYLVEWLFIVMLLSSLPFWEMST